MIKCILIKIKRAFPFVLIFLLSFNLSSTETEFTDLINQYQETEEQMNNATHSLDIKFKTLCKGDYGAKNYLKKDSEVNLLKFYGKSQADENSNKHYRLGVAKSDNDKLKTLYGYPIYNIDKDTNFEEYVLAGREYEIERRKNLIIDIINQAMWDAAYNRAVRSCVKNKNRGGQRFCYNKSRLRAKNSWLKTLEIKKDSTMCLSFKTNDDGDIIRCSSGNCTRCETNSGGDNCNCIVEAPIDIKLNVFTGSTYDRHNTNHVQPFHKSNSSEDSQAREKHFPARFISFTGQNVEIEGEIEPVSKTLQDLYEEGFCDKIIGFPEADRYTFIRDKRCWGDGDAADNCKARNDEAMEQGILEASKSFKKLGGEDNDRRIRKIYRSSIDLLGDVGKLQEECQSTCSARKSIVTNGRAALDSILSQLMQVCQRQGKVFAYNPEGEGTSGCFFECDEALFPDDDIGHYKCLCNYYNDGEEGIFWDGTNNTCGTCRSNSPNYHACLCRQIGGTFRENGDPQCSFDGGPDPDPDGGGPDPDDNTQEYVEDNKPDGTGAPSPSGESDDSSSSSSGSDGVSGGSSGSDSSSSDASKGDEEKGKDKNLKNNNKYSNSKGSKKLGGFDLYKGSVRNNKKKSSGSLKSSSQGKDPEILPKNADIFNIAELTNCTACGKGNLLNCSEVKNPSKVCEKNISGGRGFTNKKGKVK
jgi:hypothetical protein